MGKNLFSLSVSGFNQKLILNVILSLATVFFFFGDPSKTSSAASHQLRGTKRPTRAKEDRDLTSAAHGRFHPDFGVSTIAESSIVEPTTASPASTSQIRTRLVEAYGKLPLSFEANQGQTDKRVKFLARGNACPRGWTVCGKQ